MTQGCLAKEEKRKVENFLKGYGTNVRFINLDRYEKRYMGGGRYNLPTEDTPLDIPIAKARMFEVRHFILELENSEEKIFLYYRYVKGETMDHCAELLGISRRTVYRLSDRAMKLAYEKGNGKLF